MKTPEEIKDSLKVCMAKLLIPKYLDCKCCPFTKTELCDGKRHAQALAYIERLEAERDAAVKDIPRACGYCKHNDDDNFEPCRERNCRQISGVNTGWEWRGVCEENGGKDTNAPD